MECDKKGSDEDERERKEDQASEMEQELNEDQSTDKVESEKKGCAEQKLEEDQFQESKSNKNQRGKKHPELASSIFDYSGNGKTKTEPISPVPISYQTCFPPLTHVKPARRKQPEPSSTGGYCGPPLPPVSDVPESSTTRRSWAKLLVLTPINQAPEPETSATTVGDPPLLNQLVPVAPSSSSSSEDEFQHGDPPLVNQLLPVAPPSSSSSDDEFQHHKSRMNAFLDSDDATTSANAISTLPSNRVLPAGNMGPRLQQPLPLSPLVIFIPRHVHSALLPYLGIPLPPDDMDGTYVYIPR